MHACWTFWAPAPYQALNEILTRARECHPLGAPMGQVKGEVGNVFRLDSGSGHPVSRRGVRRSARSAGWSTGRSRTARPALVPCGTTGEASTLSNAEHHRVIEVCVEQAAGRVPIIAGCGSNDTMNALLHMNFSKKAGAAAALLRRALLQPAEPGGADRAFQLPGRTQRPADRALQRARPHGDRHPARDRLRTGAPLSRADSSASRTPAATCQRVTDHRMGIGKRFLPAFGRRRAGAAAQRGGRRSGCISVTANVAPSSAPSSRRPAPPTTSPRRASSTTGSIRCTTRCSRTPAPRPCKYALSRLFPDWIARRCACRWSNAATRRGRRSTRRWSTPGWSSRPSGNRDAQRCGIAPSPAILRYLGEKPSRTNPAALASSIERSVVRLDVRSSRCRPISSKQEPAGCDAALRSSSPAPAAGANAKIAEIRAAEICPRRSHSH